MSLRLSVLIVSLSCIIPSVWPLQRLSIRCDATCKPQCLFAARRSLGRAAITTATTGNLPIAKLLINNKADVNTTTKIGYTPLMSAARNGSLPIVKLLIDNGAYINSKGSHTALEIAMHFNHWEIANYLREHGAKE